MTLVWPIDPADKSRGSLLFGLSAYVIASAPGEVRGGEGRDGRNGGSYYEGRSAKQEKAKKIGS